MVSPNDLSTNTHPFNKAQVLQDADPSAHILTGTSRFDSSGCNSSYNSSTAAVVWSMVESNGMSIIVFEHIVRGGIFEQELIASQFCKHTWTHWGCCDQPCKNVTEQCMQLGPLDSRKPQPLTRYSLTSWFRTRSIRFSPEARRAAGRHLPPLTPAVSCCRFVPLCQPYARRVSPRYHPLRSPHSLIAPPVKSTNGCLCPSR